MLLILDCFIYRNFIKDLSNSYFMGIGQYPRTRSKMHDNIVHWWNRTAKNGIGAPPGTIVSAQDNDDDLSNGKMHTNDNHREPWDLSKVKCLRCQNFGYFANKCPNRAKTGKTHTNIGTKEAPDKNIDEIVSTLKIDSNTDYLFEAFAIVTNRSTKTYLEAALTTPTRADNSFTNDQSPKAFHQRN